MATGQGRYLLFQKTQREFTTWLVETAKRHGETVETVPGRQPGRDCQVPVRHWPRLALIVARKDTIPKDKITALRHIIGLLEDTGNIIYHFVVDEESKHESFINLVNLRIVLKILTRDPRRLVDPPSSYDSIAADQSGAKARERSAKMAPVSQVYSINVPGNEVLFAWVIFMQDVSSIRSQIRELWEGFARGNQSLIAVSLLTNVAIETLRADCQAQLEATKGLPDAPEETKVIPWLCKTMTGPPGKKSREWQRKYYNIANKICYEAFYMIKNTLGFLLHQPNKTPEDKFLLKVDWSSLIIPQLTNFGLLNLEKVFGPGLDEITRGWKEIRGHGKTIVIPLWLCLSYQIMLDIRYTLKTGVETGYHALVSVSNACAADVRSCIRQVDDKKVVAKILEVVSHAARCIHSDAMVTAMAAQTGTPPGTFPEIPFLLMKNHPLLCGMQIYWIQQRWQEFSLSFYSLGPSIIPAANLYNVMRIYGLVEVWHDMEFMIEMLGPERFFCGKRPVVAEDCLKRIGIIEVIVENLPNLPPPFPFIDEIFQRHWKSPQSLEPYDLSRESIRKLVAHIPAGRYEHCAYPVIKHNLAQRGYLTFNEVIPFFKVALDRHEILFNFDWMRMSQRCEDFFSTLTEHYAPRLEKIMKVSSNHLIFADSRAVFNWGAVSNPMCPPGVFHNIHIVMAHIMNNAAAKPSPNQDDLDDVLATMYPMMTPQKRSDWIRKTAELGMMLPKAASVLGPIIRDEGWSEIDGARYQIEGYKMRAKARVNRMGVGQKGGWEPPNGSEMKSHYDMAVEGEEEEEVWDKEDEEEDEEDDEEEERNGS
ncbi:hypothetical protein F5X96DRAFT_694534 [Biscogniauxia mediterranea]|nr:hypothetical protein F5X96DRAFT_694534 [Biscogniauxia mediterranea]